MIRLVEIGKIRLDLPQMSQDIIVELCLCNVLGDKFTIHHTVINVEKKTDNAHIHSPDLIPHIRFFLLNLFY